MNLEQLLEIAKPYGVKGINLGGCIKLNYKGTHTAMRNSAHAHCFPKYENYGYICVKSSKIEKLVNSNNKPTQLFWHEVSHIYRRSRSQKDCDKWAWKMVANYGKEPKPKVDSNTVKYLKALDMVKRYETKLKRDTTILKKWKRKLKRYSK